MQHLRYQLASMVLLQHLKVQKNNFIPLELNLFGYFRLFAVIVPTLAHSAAPESL